MKLALALSTHIRIMVHFLPERRGELIIESVLPLSLLLYLCLLYVCTIRAGNIPPSL
jgi:hypothetical protein